MLQLTLFDTGNSSAMSAGHPSLDRKVQMFSMAEAKAALKKHWGFTQFRTDQKTVIENVRTGKDVLAVLPTGYGKSACFQIPAVLSEGSTLVISPLIALMKDQVDDCIQRGIAATYVNSHVDEDEQEDRFNDFISGCYKLLYVAPERIRSKMFITVLKRADIRYLVIDEAHCASMWGHDSRPMYSRIKTILDLWFCFAEGIRRYSQCLRSSKCTLGGAVLDIAVMKIVIAHAQIRNINLAKGSEPQLCILNAC